MNKKIILGISILLVFSMVFFSGCSLLDIEEQPDKPIIYAEKIYPSAIGNYMTDASVDVPTIKAFMKEYNANAKEDAKINYDVIKYNKESDYYYVNDNKTDVGMKFRLDQAMNITNASIYTGNLQQTDKNVYNIVINAVETSGYKTLMTAEDKAVIQHTLNGFKEVSQSKTEVLQIFNGQENFSAKWQDNIAEFEIPVKPSELPQPDTSHTLTQLEVPKIEIPEISIDTTIFEKEHIDADTITTKENVITLQNNTNEITSVIEGLKQPSSSNGVDKDSPLNDVAAYRASMQVQKEAITNSVVAEQMELKEQPSAKELYTQIHGNTESIQQQVSLNCAQVNCGVSTYVQGNQAASGGGSVSNAKSSSELLNDVMGLYNMVDGKVDQSLPSYQVQQATGVTYDPPAMPTKGPSNKGKVDAAMNSTATEISNAKNAIANVQNHPIKSAFDYQWKTGD